MKAPCGSDGQPCSRAPRAIRPRTSRSRGVSVLSGSVSPVRLTRRLTMLGSTTHSPATTRCTASSVTGAGAAGYGRMSFAKREMQVETSPRLLAWAMHLSNEVKTVVLCSTNVPTRTANTTAVASARTPQISPAAA